MSFEDLLLALKQFDPRKITFRGIDLKALYEGKEKPQVVLFVALLSIVVLILHLFFVLRPQSVSLAATLMRSTTMMSELRGARSDIANLDKYKAESQAFKDKVERYEKRLPAEREIPSILESLSTMAKKSGVSIVGITPAPKPAPAKEEKAQSDKIYQEYPIMVSAKSGYHELGSFLARLENNDRFMKVVDMSIKANPSTPNKHDVDLMVLTYILLKEK